MIDNISDEQQRNATGLLEQELRNAQIAKADIEARLKIEKSFGKLTRTASLGLAVLSMSLLGVVWSTMESNETNLKRAYTAESTLDAIKSNLAYCQSMLRWEYTFSQDSFDVLCVNALSDCTIGWQNDRDLATRAEKLTDECVQQLNSISIGTIIGH